MQLTPLDLPLHDDRPAVTPPPLFHEAEPRGHTALAVVGALVLGLLTGFAGGFLVGQRGVSLPAPTTAADVPTPAAESFTEASIPAPAPRPAEPAVVAPPRTVEPVAPRTVAPRTVAPSHLEGSLQVASRPAGAHVFVDGALVGKTPLAVSDVAAGSHRVRLELAGYRPWSTSVNVEGGGARVRVGASLER